MTQYSYTAQYTVYSIQCIVSIHNIHVEPQAEPHLEKIQCFEPDWYPFPSRADSRNYFGPHL